MIEEILKAVKEHSELEDQSIIDAGSHGADGGFSGFTYNNDCIEFYDKNEKIIEDFAYDMAQEFGHKNTFELACTFGRADMLDMGIDGYKVLMSWLCLEEAGRYLEREREDDHENNN